VKIVPFLLQIKVALFHKPISLIIQYYHDSSSERQKEIDKCVQNNISNRCIAGIYIFSEKLEDEEEINTKFKHKKVVTVKHRKRLKYSEALEFASNQLKGHVCLLSNLDIYFDHTLQYLLQTNMTGKVFCLSRYDVTKSGGLQFNEWISKFSQDCWIFESPVPYLEMHADFLLGWLGCDNRIAFEFQSVGWQTLNPCKKIICRHLHITQKRNYTPANTVKGSYAYISPTDQLEVNKME